MDSTYLRCETPPLRAARGRRALAAAPRLFAARFAAGPRTLKIGYVSPQTGRSRRSAKRIASRSADADGA